MKSINILTRGFDTPNGLSFLFPFILFKKELRDNFKIKIFTQICSSLSDCDYLLIESKYYRDKWKKFENKIFEQFRKWNDEKIKIIFCDTTDSSSWVKSEIIKYVYKYAKGQLLNDKKLYLRPIYANRIYAEYYYKKKKVSDKKVELSKPINKAYISKLCLSWNSGLSNYSVFKPLYYKYIPIFLSKYIFKFSKEFHSPNKVRDIINCRFSSTYHLDSIKYQRDQIRKILKGYIKTDKLNRISYFKEMQRSLLSVVPFGYGEITLKDFESFINGAILMKPSMDHMQTWPNFYIPNKTYIPFSWDLKDLEKKIEMIKKKSNRYKDISMFGQELYKKYTIGKDSAELFIKHFQDFLQ